MVLVVRENLQLLAHDGHFSHYIMGRITEKPAY